MAAMYDKPVRLLMKDMVVEMGIKQGEVIQREKAFVWFKRRYPKIKDGTIPAHLGKMSTNVRTRVHYNANPNGDDDLFYRIDPSRYRLYKPSNDPTTIYKDQPSMPSQRNEDRPTEDMQADEGIPGVEFPAGDRRIDILAIGRNNRRSRSCHFKSQRC